ncbi:cytochrome P450 monooxygenase yanC [Colletotrichum spaethianum]|uniref:Cytochrome P450 monooxygenase yanC n=1 Tax=Colletotrichum spaethianum TaxID=700344 RepID=A0AA37PEI7_9PEZI|nr:cytochrome P450 monooxygenase yanC [Colletotrichum spaethianum]GKT50816.1 cytochrome P450 monooxygenase yanC [Colletotrichum spaethianum]
MVYVFLIPLAVIAIAVFQLRNVGRRPKDYPPGPPTLPLIGNLHQIPSKQPHHQFQKWAKEYGPVYSLILGTKVMVVLSSDLAVKDLLNKRSSIYSSRTDVYLGNVVSANLRVVLMVLNISAAKGYVPYQDLESKQMLSGFLDEPHHFIDHIRRFTNSLTTQMVFGFRTASIHDEKLKKLYHCIEKWSEVVGSSAAALLDVYPILRSLGSLLPGKRYAKGLHREERALYVGHWMDAKSRVLQGTAKPCFCMGILESQKTLGFSDDLAGYISGSALEAGSDTTAATLTGFVQAMVLYPSVQKQAREELDRICGTERLPTLDDWESMPYIRACIKEALRWMPTAILGIPHAVIKDDEYMGYKIPKGAGVILNVWAINMDEARFEDPRAFNPSRYEGDDQNSFESAMNGNPAKRDHYVFGAGRRLCQGMHIADRSLFLSISRLLWAFNFDRAVDGQGRELVPDADDLIEGVLVQPRPFPAKITPRSEAHAQIIRKEWEASQELLDEDKQWEEIPRGMVYESLVSSDLKE